jgi:hypothetical protein
MSEAQDAEQRRLLGGFAAAFLMAAGYNQYDVDRLEDLSDVCPERIRELLSAKLQEQKRVFEAAKNARFGPLPGAEKPRRKVAHKRRA